MYRIYKYVFELNDTFSIIMPGHNPKVLKIGKQEGQPKGVYSMWVLVCPGSTLNTEKTFRVFGTGHDVPFDTSTSHNKYIDSIIDGVYVWHFFECE